MRRIWMTAVAVLAAVLVAAAWSTKAIDCARPEEPARPLDLNNPSDRAHLDADEALIRRTAERFRDYVRTVPMGSQSIDARRDYAQLPDRAYQYCVTVLNDKIAAVDHLDRATLPSPSGTQAKQD